METPVIVLLNSGGEGLADQCRALSPRIEVLTRAELDREPACIERVEIVYGGLPPDRWKSAPRLRWVQATGAGVDSVLTPEVTRSGVVLTNVSGIHAAPITQHMFGMLLAYERKLYQAWDLQQAPHWDSRPLRENLPLLQGRTLGLLGVGEIGRFSARVGRAFGMRVVGLRRSREPLIDIERVYGPDELLAFLAESDVVMNTLPLTAATRGLLGKAELAAMKPGSILINTGRGSTIQTPELMAALAMGRPAAALLDVTDPEPLPDDHPLWKMPNVVITPHYAGSHSTYDLRAEAIFLDNLRRYLAGDPLTHVVDKEAGY